MEIHISVNDGHLLELIYFRELLTLPTTPSLPALNHPATTQPSAATLENDAIALWTERWESLWEQTWRWLAEFESARRVVPPAELFASVGLAPRWTELYSDDRFDPEALTSWKRTVEPPLPTWPSPEHESVEALSGAWSRGLTSCYVFPFVGQFAQQLEEHALVVSPDVRNDAAEYSRALAEFSAS